VAQSVTPFLMFEGDAEAAIELYASLFDNDRFGVSWQLNLPR
jgi:predicted 3-demethylubiquinone-9 3-methyltransferase (glyoxalase superfamily)